MMKGELISTDQGKLTPCATPKLLCSHCLRPMPPGPLEYICQECGANHYKNEWYICCPYDSEMPIEWPLEVVPS